MNFFNDAGSWDPGYQAASDGLESVCGWGISPRTIPNAFSYEQVVRSLLQTKEPPDLVKWGSGYRMRDLARTGALAALDDEWTSSVSKGWLSDAMTADFTYGDHIYGLPLIQGYYVLTFNVSVWDELGLSKPETWDDFISVCEELKAAGLAPIGTTQQNMWPTANWFSMLSAAFSSEWYDKVCANEASFLDDEPREMLQLWQDMINAGTTRRPILSMTTSRPWCKPDAWACGPRRSAGRPPTSLTWGSSRAPGSMPSSFPRCTAENRQWRPRSQG